MRIDADTLHGLCGAYCECSKNNWDGYGALAVSKEAYFKVLDFIESLPLELPMPDSIAAEPDGCLTLEWHDEGTLSVSIGGDGKVCYAALFGEEKDWGHTWGCDGVVADLIRKASGGGDGAG